MTLTLQNLLISPLHASFMGNWKSMFSEKRTSSSNRVARQMGLRSFLFEVRQRMTRAEPGGMAAQNLVLSSKHA